MSRRFVPQPPSQRKQLLREMLGERKKILREMQGGPRHTAPEEVKLPPIGKSVQLEKPRPPCRIPSKTPFTGPVPKSSDRPYTETKSRIVRGDSCHSHTRTQLAKNSKNSGIKPKIEHNKKKEPEPTTKLNTAVDNDRLPSPIINPERQKVFHFMRPTATYQNWAAKEVKFPYKPRTCRPQKKESTCPSECVDLWSDIEEQRNKREEQRNKHVVKLPPLCTGTVGPTPPKAQFIEAEYIDRWLDTASGSRHPHTAVTSRSQHGSKSDWINLQELRSRCTTGVRKQPGTLKLKAIRWHKRKLRDHFTQFASAYLSLRELGDCLNLKGFSDMMISMIESFQEATEEDLGSAIEFMNDCLNPLKVKLAFDIFTRKLLIAVRAKDKLEQERFRQQMSYQRSRGSKYITIRRTLLRSGEWLDFDEESEVPEPVRHATTPTEECEEENVQESDYELESLYIANAKAGGSGDFEFQSDSESDSEFEFNSNYCYEQEFNFGNEYEDSSECEESLAGDSEN